MSSLLTSFPSKYISLKSFHFTDETDIVEISCSSSDSLCSETDQHVCNESCLIVKINEILDPEFGMHVWPSAPVLGKYIWTRREEVKGKHVVELGAGTALPSVVAAKCGAQVIITDAAKYKSTLQISNCNMQLNEIDHNMFKIIDLTWGMFSPYLINIEQISIILGSDVFYDSLDYEDIFVTISYILKRNKNAEFWCAYEHRSAEWDVNHLLRKWNLICHEVSLESFGADKFNIAGYDLPGHKTISLFVIRYCEVQ